jgi:hypothetical protein
MKYDVVDAVLFQALDSAPKFVPTDGLGALSMFKGMDDCPSLSPLTQAMGCLEKKLREIAKVGYCPALISLLRDAESLTKAVNSAQGNFHGMPWGKVMMCPRDDESLGNLFPLEGEYVKKYRRWQEASRAASAAIDACEH